jgi:polyhydroxybutyrate depolymerase
MLFAVLLAALVSSSPDAVSAQTIDAGRGELPLVVPSDYDPGTPLPLVVLLHGYGSSGARQEAYMRFGALADSHQFLLVNPDGTEESGGENRRFWNASEACCNFMRSTVDDSAYVMSIVDAVKAQYSIDPKRVYLIGHSNGGFMSYRTAYDHSDTIAAIASIAGAASTDEPPAPSNPVHVLQIHGTDDSTIVYDGGAIRDHRYPGAVGTVERWAAYNGCGSEGRDGGTLDLEGEIAGKETTVVQYADGCTAGGSSELWTIAGGSHVPSISDTFSQHVIEWLLAHPKP